MTTQTATETDFDIDILFDTIEKNIEANHQKETSGNKIQKIRDMQHMKIGQTTRQGDIYITRLDPAKVKLGKVVINRQLAPGTSIGSSHRVGEDPRVHLHEYLFEDEKTDYPIHLKPGHEARVIRQILGPVIVADNAFTIFHQKHAWVKLAPGCYHVTYQMDAKTRLRALD